MTDEKPKEEQDAPRRPYRVGGPLNYFGTRRRRRIECEACGKVDYVSFVPKEDKKVFCGACAREQLALYEEGEQIPSELKVVDCPECGRTFTLPEHIPFTDELVCSDCHKGFETWQGAKGAPKEASEYQKGASGTILRKKNKQVPEN